MASDIQQLAEKVIKASKSAGQTIATAESCTGGWISKALTDISGSSSVYKGSLIAYSNAVKENLLGVSKGMMIEHGAVSEAVVVEMAKNCAQSFDADIALSVTGIAGPGGGSAEKPVGLVYMGVYFEGKVASHRFIFENNGREGIRRAATIKGLEFLLDP